MTSHSKPKTKPERPTLSDAVWVVLMILFLIFSEIDIPNWLAITITFWMIYRCIRWGAKHYKHLT